jgi:hypothetical protein
MFVYTHPPSPLHTHGTPDGRSNQYGSDAMVHELEGSQNTFAVPLLDTMVKLARMLPGTAGVDAKHMCGGAAQHTHTHTRVTAEHH